MVDFAVLKGLLVGLIAAAAVMGLMRREGTSIPDAVPTTQQQSTSHPTSHQSGHQNGHQNDSITIARAKDGHFWVDADINGETIHFLIDTGASHVILTPDDAKRLRLDLIADDYTLSYATASGHVAAAQVTLDQINIGPLSATNVIAAVNDHPMPHSLLGMSYLNLLSQFSVNGNTMTLVQ